ncbi:MAG: glycoside hydrolase family 95-like protein [Bacteroidota bacterium]
MKFLFTIFLTACLTTLFTQPLPTHNLQLKTLPPTWDQGLPMGNAILGCLLWGKDGAIRLALDRVDLWDLRPMKGLDRPEFNYKWVAEQVAKGDYGMVQQYFDAPYEQEAGPTKLPGAAIELRPKPGAPTLKLSDGDLDIASGLSTLHFGPNLTVQSFVDAVHREGWFRVEGPDAAKQLEATLISPWKTAQTNQTAGGSVNGDGLGRLGYTAAEVQQENGVWYFHQPCWGGFSYEAALKIIPTAKGYDGVWTISSHFKQKQGLDRASEMVQKAARRGFDAAFRASSAWWAKYWAKSALHVPDSLIERQYYLDMYKFGCVARAGAPMISLQAIWTADNGRLPPWKGDFHHDLNTQMSYWPAYTANHLHEARGYLNHLESTDASNHAYTKRYFGTDGLNIPGVATLLGEPMGGWIQYSCSPTTSAWLAQHFYLQWRYSKDRTFLKDHAWPFLHDVALHLEQLTALNDKGLRVLPLSSSPEINDNSLQAWFPNTMTNYDLALTRFVYEKTAELALELRKTDDAKHWQNLAASLPKYALTETQSLKFAPNLAYTESHRHFSHLMAIYPLGLIDWNKNVENQTIIKHSIDDLLKYGPANWTGYSYAWLASLQARAHHGDGAREALSRFASAFVSPNSFHLNGDQSGRGFSSFTYSPFTLEGNFAAAAGLQEMLLQSHSLGIEVFPAVPDDWANVSFKHLLAEGAFLVSAVRENGKTLRIEIEAVKNEKLRLYVPDSMLFLSNLKKGKEITSNDPLIRVFDMQGGGKLVFEQK